MGQLDDQPALVTCPTCGSSQPHLHPTSDLCPDPYHRPVPTSLIEWRREVARWADLLDTVASVTPGGALGRLAEEMRREVRESGADAAAQLRCPRCGGEVEVEVEYLGYYRDTNVLGMECIGSTLPVTRDACGARWTPDGDPR